MSEKTRTERQIKVNQSLTKIVSDFINENSNRQSLITVTHCDVSPDLRNAVAYISILPEDKEGPAFDFLQRREHDLFDFAKKRSELRRTPRIKFAIDYGEKNRQRIQDISRELSIEEE